MQGEAATRGGGEPDRCDTEELSVPQCCHQAKTTTRVSWKKKSDSAGPQAIQEPVRDMPALAHRAIQIRSCFWCWVQLASWTGYWVQPSCHFLGESGKGAEAEAALGVRNRGCRPRIGRIAGLLAGYAGMQERIEREIKDKD